MDFVQSLREYASTLDFGSLAKDGAKMAAGGMTVWIGRWFKERRKAKKGRGDHRLKAMRSVVQSLHALEYLGLQARRSFPFRHVVTDIDTRPRFQSAVVEAESRLTAERMNLPEPFLAASEELLYDFKDRLNSQLHASLTRFPSEFLEKFDWKPLKATIPKDLYIEVFPGEER